MTARQTSTPFWRRLLLPDTPQVVAEVVRSGFVESVHRGSVVAIDPAGAVLLAIGDSASPVFPRSSNKPMQAAAMVDQGIVESFGLEPQHLAVMAASHSGEPMHVDAIRDLLHRADVPESALQCPHDMPLSTEAAAFLVSRELEPGRIHHNCSGKHAGMLVTCAAQGWPQDTYRRVEHPLQVAIRAELEADAGEPVAGVGVDGCGAPVFGLTLLGLARAIASVGRAAEESSRGQVAAAMRAHPELVGGTGRDVTALIRAVPGIVAKDGAEGVYAAALPDGTAVALKIADGSQRARAAVMVAALRRVGVDVAAAEQEGLHEVAVLGGGEPVGVIRAAGVLA
ncbi:MAG TPA: asparaginase [Mycobacteriales bacterium]|nr:asparaginase [Mycobacteriales bacterium]